MDLLDSHTIYWIFGAVVSVLACVNGGFEFYIEASGSISAFLMVLGIFSLFFLLALII